MAAALHDRHRTAAWSATTDGTGHQAALRSDIVASPRRPRANRLAGVIASLVSVGALVWIAATHLDTALWILIGGALAAFPAAYGRWRVRRAAERGRWNAP